MKSKGHPTSFSPRASEDDEERKALIPHDEEAGPLPSPREGSPPPSPLSPHSYERGGGRRHCKTMTALLLAVLLLGAALPYRGLLVEDCDARTRRLEAAAGLLKSNGTHAFRRTAVIVSIDGLR